MSHHMRQKCVSILVVFFFVLLLSLQVSASEQPERADSTRVAVSDLAIETKNNVAQTVEQAESNTSTPTETSTDPRARILNEASTLTPTSPGCEDLAVYLEDVMDDLVHDDMTTYQQVKACYDYLVQNTRYGSHMQYSGTRIGDVTASQIIRQYGTVEGYGAIALGSNVGMCNAYASAFILMAREIGLDAYLVKGATRGAGGGYVVHHWAEVNIDGTLYVFDPQLEQNLTAAGLGTYNVFAVTYDQVPGRYVKH